MLQAGGCCTPLDPGFPTGQLYMLLLLLLLLLLYATGWRLLRPP
jgi:hypothetical protein